MKLCCSIDQRSPSEVELFEGILPELCIGKMWMLVATLASKIENYALAKEAFERYPSQMNYDK